MNMMLNSEHLSFKIQAEKCPAHEYYGCRLLVETFLPGSHRRVQMCEGTVKLNIKLKTELPMS
jgi:hypothetical protein